MPRKAWRLLSDAYRKRLLRHGIDQKLYESGASLSQARGHRATPEHPQEVNPTKHARYVNTRAERAFPAFIYQDASDEDGNGVPPFEFAVHGNWTHQDKFKIARHWHMVKQADFTPENRIGALFTMFQGMRIGGHRGIPRYRFETRAGVILKWLRSTEPPLPYESLYEFAEDLT